ncbi:hypothetical protein F5X99DRAFT_91770 [Biscogniauxia marginata]|nr:hypothetical protein F5X99DRAFT_91770 [Biscogniauxia marginata]
MQVLPFVQVRDLAPSASFYSAITQPLGLRYLSASPTNIVFGDASGAPEPVFEVKKSTGAPRPARLVLSAHASSVVSAFHAAALRANPDLKKILSSTPTGGDGHTEIPDFDGNVMEVVYVNPPDYPSDYAGSTVRRTQSTPQEVSRILDWNLDVATSAPPSRAVAPIRSEHPSRAMAVRGGRGDEPYTQLKRSMTTSSVESPSAREREASRSSGGGMAFGSVLAGVAAGALVGGTLAYTVLRKNSDRPQAQVYEAPAMPRRATYTDQPRQIEVERSIVDKTQYPETTVSKKYPPSAYGSRYSQAGGPKSKTLDDFDDRASRHSTYYNGGSGSRARTRSVSESTRRPLMITDVEHRSNAGGSRQQHSEATPAKSEAASAKLLIDADARSQASTVMPPHLHKIYPEADYRTHKNLTRQAAAAAVRRPRDQPVRAPSPPRAPSVYGHDDVDDYRSQAASATRRAPREPSRTRRAYREPDAETYVSARTERSAASTVRPGGSGGSPGKKQRPTAESMASSRMGGGGGGDRSSRYSTATGTTATGTMATPRARRSSSRARSSAARSVAWDDDIASVAPSDSISCIGDKHDGRKRSYY